VFQRGGERHFRRRNNGVRHSRQDNTRVAAGSTLAPCECDGIEMS
jgi:hypothetical protein